MSELHAALRDYLAVRRALGFALKDAGRMLADFADYACEQGCARITTELALAWATRPAGANPVWWRQRLGMVRDFARYLKSVDPSTEVPPRDLLPAAYRRSAPFVYSDADVATLMAAARALSPPLRAATYETLIGLLAVSGLRIGEAIRLTRADLQEADAMLQVSHAKGDSARRVPLHATTMRALHTYGQQRDRHFPVARSEYLLVSIRGTRLSQSAVNETFRELTRRAGLDGRGPRPPRIHDLRHSFAVNTQIDWYRHGVNVEAKLPTLSAVLGHTGPGSTYWYLQAVPQLLALACQRLDDTLDQEGPA
jgi:integrase